MSALVMWICWFLGGVVMTVFASDSTGVWMGGLAIGLAIGFLAGRASLRNNWLREKGSRA